MINWSTLIKKFMQTYIVIISGRILNVSTVHLNGIWHLIWRYLSKPVLGGHPVLSGHYSIPRGCPLNTGFTVCGNWLTPTKNLTISKYVWKSFNLTHSNYLWFYITKKTLKIYLAVSNAWFFKVQLREILTKVSTGEVGNATHSPQYGSKFYFPLLQASTSCKNTWNTLPYLGLNGLSMILCLWSLLIPLSKLLAIQAHVQNMKEQDATECILRRRGCGTN